MPLLPPKWQVQLGVERPERPPAQIARLEQALPEVLPAVAPGGQPPPVQQQGPDYAGDDQELQQHGQGASAQPGTGQEQEPGFQVGSATLFLVLLLLNMQANASHRSLKLRIGLSGLGKFWLLMTASMQSCSCC